MVTQVCEVLPEVLHEAIVERPEVSTSPYHDDMRLQHMI